MEAIEMLRGRRSVRKFTKEQVARKDIETIIDCARLAASARNEQPWQFVAVTVPGTIRKIAEMTDHGKFLAEAPLCLCVFCKDSKYYLEDGCAATQNILLAAHALGLGSCWIAGDKKPYCVAMADLLGLPKDYKLISLVAVGHPQEKVEAHNKRALTEVLSWEKFS